MFKHIFQIAVYLIIAFGIVVQDIDYSSGHKLLLWLSYFCMAMAIVEAVLFWLKWRDDIREDFEPVRLRVYEPGEYKPGYDFGWENDRA